MIYLLSFVLFLLCLRPYFSALPPLHDISVLQIIFVWNKLLFYAPTRGLVLEQQQAVAYLLDLMHDKNDEIRRVCNGALDIIAECDEVWAKEIRAKRFEFHNAVWLQLMKDQHLRNVSLFLFAHVALLLITSLAAARRPRVRGRLRAGRLLRRRIHQ